MVGHAKQPTDEVGEGAFGEPHGIPGPETLYRRRQVERAVLLLAAQALDDLAADRYRLVAGGHQPDNPAGRADGPPGLSLAIDADEEIARKERPQHRRLATRMPDDPAVARQVCRVALTDEMLDRPRLAIGLRIGDVPGDHDAPPLPLRRGRAEMRSSSGASTRSAGRLRSAAAANISSKRACGALVSVTMSASSAAPPTAESSRTTGRPAQRSPSPPMIATISTPVSVALSTAISARSPVPTRTSRRQPRASQAASTAAQSRRARRKKSSEYVR